MSIELIGLVVFGLWISVITFFLFKLYSHFRRLSHEVKKGNLIEVLDKVISNEANNARDLSRLEKELKGLTDNVQFNIQKVGFVRFNPFSEMGGDHSFSLALLNGFGSGVILTGLHTRERTRVYMKNIEKGKSKYELSKEEKKALTKALKSKYTHLT